MLVAVGVPPYCAEILALQMTLSQFTGTYPHTNKVWMCHLKERCTSIYIQIIQIIHTHHFGRTYNMLALRLLRRMARRRRRRRNQRLSKRAPRALPRPLSGWRQRTLFWASKWSRRSWSLVQVFWNGCRLQTHRAQTWRIFCRVLQENFKAMCQWHILRRHVEFAD